MMLAFRIDKAPDDSRVYGFDFYQFPELRGGDTVASGVITADTGINVFTPTASGTSLLAQISGGTAGTTYRLKIVVTLASGTILATFADVAVAEPATAS